MSCGLLASGTAMPPTRRADGLPKSFGHRNLRSTEEVARCFRWNQVDSSPRQQPRVLKEWHASENRKPASLNTRHTLGVVRNHASDVATIKGLAAGGPHQDHQVYTPRPPSSRRKPPLTLPAQRAQRGRSASATSLRQCADLKHVMVPNGKTQDSPAAAHGRHRSSHSENAPPPLDQLSNDTSQRLLQRSGFSECSVIQTATSPPECPSPGTVDSLMHNLFEREALSRKIEEAMRRKVRGSTPTQREPSPRIQRTQASSPRARAPSPPEHVSGSRSAKQLGAVRQVSRTSSKDVRRGACTPHVSERPRIRLGRSSSHTGMRAGTSAGRTSPARVTGAVRSVPGELTPRVPEGQLLVAEPV
mmetsp:Transcript_8679/g.24224  ORF Transcript_8679/g.24224 Transcript_8679/m.24224 type:complete len:360 (-) Transcript_8679:393-1472(-)